ncbi:hypothetical protein GCM10027084_05190 [Pseudoxanthomonas sangjuensis]
MAAFRAGSTASAAVAEALAMASAMAAARGVKTRRDLDIDICKLLGGRSWVPPAGRREIPAEAGETVGGK